MFEMRIRLNVSKLSLLGIIAIFLVSIKSGSAIKCFYCDSSQNPGCTDLKSNSSIKAEVCTLEKLKSLNTWLSELQKIDYMDSWPSSPNLQNIPMHCQKVVGKRQGENEVVTARFCQLDARDSDACTILKGKVQSSGSGDEIIFCDICKTDNCNSATSMQIFTLIQLFATTLIGLGLFQL